MNEEVENVTELNSHRSSNIALPSTVSELLEMRKSEKKQTLNDQVEMVHMDLYANDAYRQMLDAVWPEQALEGSLQADDFQAAMMIREHAKQKGHNYVAKQKLDTIRKCLGVVLRRYGISRKERRES